MDQTGIHDIVKQFRLNLIAQLFFWDIQESCTSLACICSAFLNLMHSGCVCADIARVCVEEGGSVTHELEMKYQ